MASFCVFSSAEVKSLHLVSPPWLPSAVEQPVIRAVAARADTRIICKRFMGSLFPINAAVKPRWLPAPADDVAFAPP